MNFFSDLDNTLIYSHRRNIPEPKVTVEWLKGKKQSFMTKNTFNFLVGNSKIQLIPVTTRTVEQYGRLAGLADTLNISYALVCNGGVLLNDGVIDGQWLSETLRMAEPARDEFIHVKEAVCELCGEEHIHEVEGIMIYGKSDTPEQIVNTLLSRMELSEVLVFCDGRKFYCLPRTVNKGTAVRRFANRFNITVDIAAGDGIADIPMLESADYAIVPESLKNKIDKTNLIMVSRNTIFSDQICEILSPS